MTIKERLELINKMCSVLEVFSSRTDKELTVAKYRQMDEQLSKDIDYVFEIMSGMHKLGYRFTICTARENDLVDLEQDISLEEFLKPLYSIESKDEMSIHNVCKRYTQVGNILYPILNREWRTGINKSQIAKNNLSPMLAKKYEPGKHCKNDNELYYLTEKLDGNRCIAVFNYEDDSWDFISRSGKTLKVNFDMGNLPIDKIYDGEILSLEQIEHPGQRNFNTTSGIINSKYSDEKDKLVYNIFDIPSSEAVYSARRDILSEIFKNFESPNVRLLPVITIARSKNIEDAVKIALKAIEDEGGEGVMINLGSRLYEHKRTDALLKVKSVYTMDMKVFDIEYGTGKYADAVGSLYCVAYDGNVMYECSVGSGLSDDERFYWASHPEKILGKIVEVAYFSTSQDKNSSKNQFSLRFPRFKGVREDKNDTSVD